MSRCLSPRTLVVEVGAGVHDVLIERDLNTLSLFDPASVTLKPDEVLEFVWSRPTMVPADVILSLPKPFPVSDRQAVAVQRLLKAFVSDSVSVAKEDLTKVCHQDFAEVFNVQDGQVSETFRELVIAGPEANTWQLNPVFDEAKKQTTPSEAAE